MLTQYERFCMSEGQPRRNKPGGYGDILSGALGRTYTHYLIDITEPTELAMKLRLDRYEETQKEHGGQTYIITRRDLNERILRQNPEARPLEFNLDTLYMFHFFDMEEPEVAKEVVTERKSVLGRIFAKLGAMIENLLEEDAVKEQLAKRAA